MIMQEFHIEPINSKIKEQIWQSKMFEQYEQTISMVRIRIEKYLKYLHN